MSSNTEKCLRNKSMYIHAIEIKNKKKHFRNLVKGNKNLNSKNSRPLK